MIYKATNLIAETFDEKDVKYHIEEKEDFSVVEAGFEVEAGPALLVRFISKDDDSDVAIRVFGVVHKIPEAKKEAILQVCNSLNKDIRFVKFLLADDGSVNLEADLPISVEESCVGECCFEYLVRIMSILDHEYHRFMEVLYSSANPSRTNTLDFIKELQKLRENPLRLVEEHDTRTTGTDN